MPKGRPKQSTEYFPHLLKDSTTIRALEMLYGNDGYAVWFKLLEVLGSSPNYQYIVKTTDSCNKLLEKFKIDSIQMKKILNTLCDLNAIDKEMWKNRVLFVPNLVNNIQKMKRKVNSNTNLAENKETKIIPSDKKKYLDYVYLTDEEYQKLVNKFGEESTKERIENLDNWIGEKPTEKKRQKDSHYRTILMWDNLDKKRQANNQPKKQPQYRDLSNYSCD